MGQGPSFYNHRSVVRVVLLLSLWGASISIPFVTSVKFQIIYAIVQSSSSSRAHSKRVMNQTMFDVPDPLVVHVLLLTHKFMYNNVCLLILGFVCVTVHIFHVPKTDDSPSLFNAVS